MMGSLTFSEYSDSSTIFYPPTHHSFDPLSHHASLKSFHPNMSHSTQWQPIAPPARPSLSTRPSRKRSRDDVDDDDNWALPVTTPALPDKVTEYGEGMTLIDKSTGRAIGADSQTGTWYEEHLELERLEAQKAAESLTRSAGEAAVRPAKCQRLVSPTCPSLSNSDDSAATDGYSASLNDDHADAVAQLLGVGWSSISKDSHTQQAAQGWAKYIQNHYPSLYSVTVLCRSKSHNAYLASAAESAHGVEGFFLFSEDLNQGQMVAHTWEACVQNLRVTPIVFEGEQILQAERSPSPMRSSSPFLSDVSTNATSLSISVMDID